MARSVTPDIVYAIATDITSALGMGVAEHWRAVESGSTGITAHEDGRYSSTPFYGSKLNKNQLAEISTSVTGDGLTTFEQLCIFSARQALAQLKEEPDLSRTCFILSSTKGNIEQLDELPEDRTTLDASAVVIAEELNITNQPLVISHACISGSVALLYAHRLITGGRYDHVIVAGCDRFTPFVLNGFQSFQAIADGPCRPFDAGRTGINLGEAAATVILSKESQYTPLAALLGGATSNDANHISGPSRTGEELSDAINRALTESGIAPTGVNMVSAHGTATAYNDEMEAKALNLSGLSDVPVHSMKSYTGHTLGAAGVLESVMSIEAIQQQKLIPSLGYKEHGVPVPLNVTTQPSDADIQYVLKTASGFGGSNAAIIWGRI